MRCLFCGKRLQGQNACQTHIGRHMEEIAFAVVRRPYDEWEFYSDSSDAACREEGSAPTPGMGPDYSMFEE